MAETFIPVQTANLTNQTSITQAIDQNFSKISTMFSDVLSRGGTTPNQMASTLDMNSNQIINLPAPVTVNSPVRLQDLANQSGVSVSSNIISSNNTWTGTNTFTNGVSANVANLTSVTTGNITSSGTVTANNFKVIQGNPWADVTAWGADPSGVVESSSSIQAAINYMQTNYGGGVVFFPLGTYLIHSPLQIGRSAVWLKGAGYALSGGNTILTTGTSDNLMVSFQGQSGTAVLPSAGGGIENMSLVGLQNNTATSHGVDIGVNVATTLRDVWVWGSYIPIYNQGTDCLLENVYCNGNGFSNVYSTAANWYLRCKLDSSSSAYGFYQAGSVAGATGGPQENHFVMCDFSNTPSGAVVISDSFQKAVSVFDTCVFGNTTSVASAEFTIFNGCEFGTPIKTQASSGIVVVSGCIAFSPITGVSNNSTIVTGCYNIS